MVDSRRRQATRPSRPTPVLHIMVCVSPQNQGCLCSAHPLGQRRQMAQELYTLELRLPQQRLVASPAR